MEIKFLKSINHITKIKDCCQVSTSSKKSENIRPYIVDAINLLLRNQVSDTLILSSYKISTVLKNHFGKDFKTERIGRCLAGMAKAQKLKRLHTKIPKYELRKSKFKGFQLPD